MRSPNLDNPDRRGLAIAWRMLVASLVLIPPAVSVAQTSFQRTYGGPGSDCCYSVEQTRDGGFVLVGSTASSGAGEDDVYLVRIDATGGVLWTRTYGGTNVDCGQSVCQAADGGFVVAGYTYSFGAGARDIYLVRTDSIGDTIWTRTFGGAYDDLGYSVCEALDGNLVVAGYTGSFGAGSCDAILIKVDANGHALWSQTFGGTDFDAAFSVRPAADGFILAGCTWSTGAGADDVYLVKTDSGGRMQWSRTFGGANGDIGSSVRRTGDGGYIVAGTTASFNAVWDGIYLIRTGPAGDTLWTRVIDGRDYDEATSVDLCPDGGYIVAGRTFSSGAGNDDAYLVRTGASGDTVWTRTFGGLGSDGGTSVLVARDSGYAVAGCTESFGAGASDMLLVKTDAGGRIGVLEPAATGARLPGLELSCRPNPMSDRALISYSAPDGAPVSLSVFGLSGRLVARLPVGAVSRGTVRWYGCDAAGQRLPPGTYLCRLVAASGCAVTTAVILLP